MSDGPDLIERVRMCLAEVGEDPEGIWRGPDGTIFVAAHVSKRMAWKARCLVLWTEKRRTDGCWACAHAASLKGTEACKAVRTTCRAYLPLTEDCGVSR
jgi:hypothetical protein